MTVISGLCASDIYPAHREKLERWAQKHPSQLSRKEFTSQDREIARMFRYYQHMGLLPRASSSQKEHLEEAHRRTVSAVSSAKIPGSKGDILAGTRIADDVLLAPRHFLYAIPPTEWVNFFTQYLYVGAGVVWSALAVQELYSGVRECARAEKIDDKEGQQRAKVRIGSGALISGASLSYLGGAIGRHVELAPHITNGLLSGANALFGAGSILSMGSSIAGILRCDRFRNRLDEYLRHPTLSLKDRMRGAVSFLKDSLCVTPEESQQIVDQIEKEHPELSVEQKEALVHQKSLDLAETKVKYTKRRTSGQSLHKILTQADAILQKLEDPSQVNAGICDATLLVYEVRKDNMNKKVLYAMGLLASFISVIAMGLMILFHLEAIAILLYGLSAAICLVMIVNPIVGLLNHTKPDEMDLCTK